MPEGTTHWDHVYARWEDKRYLSARTIAQAAILIVPLFYVAFEGWEYTSRMTANAGSIIALTATMLLDLAVLIATVRLHLWSYRCRESDRLFGGYWVAKMRGSELNP